MSKGYFDALNGLAVIGEAIVSYLEDKFLVKFEDTLYGLRPSSRFVMLTPQPRNSAIRLRIRGRKLEFVGLSNLPLREANWSYCDLWIRSAGDLYDALECVIRAEENARLGRRRDRKRYLR